MYWGWLAGGRAGGLYELSVYAWPAAACSTLWAVMPTHPGMLSTWLSQGKQFRVIVTEGRPDETGLTMARVLEEMRVPTTVVLDSAVGYVMER